MKAILLRETGGPERLELADVPDPEPGDGEVVVRPMLDLMLTCDHRSVNGADGAAFLQAVKEILEEPGLAL